VQLADGGASWLLSHLGADFTLMVYDADVDVHVDTGSVSCAVLTIKKQNTQKQNTAKKLGKSSVLIDCDGLIAKRYDMQPGTAYLLRPDQHICARWRQVTLEKLQAAFHVALAKN
jgi:3-(3-hydroxy-phenyl)propionate hydroxylase